MKFDLRPILVLLGACLLFSCGGGGGDTSDPINQPAPQTLHGLELELYANGVNMVFIRDGGDTYQGQTETGGVIIAPDPEKVSLVDEFGAPYEMIPSAAVSLATYVYDRTGPETAVITVTGTGSGLDSEGKESNYFLGEFERRYDILFATDGAIITAIGVSDSGEELEYPGITWVESTLKQFSGDPVPVGYTIQLAEGSLLPYLYPDSINQQAFTLDPENGDPDLYYAQLLQSEFTRFSTERGDFLEKGVANETTEVDPTLILVNYEYNPDPGTINEVTLTIKKSVSSLNKTYQMKFLDYESGTYVDEVGGTGTFNFPFLLE